MAAVWQPLWILSLILLRVLSQSPVTGDSSCPCINVTPPGLPAGFGINCSAHFLAAGASNVQAGATCKNSLDAPSWCNSSWCFVNTKACSLKTSSFDALGSYISYATCGYLDEMSPQIQAQQLQGDVIRIANLNNSAGFSGSYYFSGTGWSGPTYTYWQQLVASTNASVKVVLDLKQQPWPNLSLPYPAAVMRQFRRDMNTSKSIFDSCVYATGMGFVDVCIGSMTINEARVRVSQMIEFEQVRVALVVKQSLQRPSFAEQVNKAWKPFHPNLWGMIIGVVILASLLITIHEAVDQRKQLQMRSPASYVDHGSGAAFQLYNGWQALFGGGLPADNPSSLAGRLTSMGLSLFILMCVSAYTANMAAFLVQQQQATGPISSVKDIINNPQFSICCENQLVGSFVSKLGLGLPQIVGIEGRGAVLKALQGLIPGSECDAAGVIEEDFLQEQASGRMCEYASVEFLMAIGQGVSVSDKVARALQWIHKKMENSGTFDDLLEVASAQYTSNCKQPKDQTDGILGPEALYGALIGATPFFIAGVLVSFVAVSRRMIPSSRKVCDESVEDDSSEVVAMKKVLSVHSDELSEIKLRLGKIIDRLENHTSR